MMMKLIMMMMKLIMIMMMMIQRLCLITSAPSLKRKRICRRVNKAVHRTFHIDEDMMKMMVMNDGVREMMKR